MLLLCAGVLIVGTTWRGFAASLDVTATVPANPLTEAATITSPADQEHFSTAEVSVTGTCPAQSYVKLYRNAVFSGVAQCAGGTYDIQTGLVQGENQLEAQAYNLTDQAGPGGTPITVYYDKTTQSPAPPPATIPTTVWVEHVEDVTFKQGVLPATSNNPTLTGWAPPRSFVTATYHSDPITCVTRADDSGRWSCTLDRELPEGIHSVEVRAVTPAGDTLTFPTFQIRVVAARPAIVVAAPGVEPLMLLTDYHYQVQLSHQSADLVAGLSGGVQPYHITADWGDGTTTALERTDTSPFTLSHTYPMPRGANKNYAVLVRATDRSGQTSLVQLGVVVKGDGVVLVANSATLGGFLQEIHRWLWLIWPAYTVVVLMAIGYYLGEREEYQHLMTRKRARTAGKAK